MPKVKVSYEEFTPGNKWGIKDNPNEDFKITMSQLIHAAITAGHGHGWRQSVGNTLGGKMELLWKATSLLTTVEEKQHGASKYYHSCKYKYLIPTNRFWELDPSERRALSYHLGNTMSVVWARHVLKFPWLLHLDLYRQKYGVNLGKGQSRPDFIGVNKVLEWLVVESKGRSSQPSKDAKEKAKKQSKRVTNIGGNNPDLCIATFAYFYHDDWVGEKHQLSLNMSVIDPPPRKIDRDDDEEEGDVIEHPIELPNMKPSLLFKLYYEELIHVFENECYEEGDFTWVHIGSMELRIGILTKLKSYLENSNSSELNPIEIIKHFEAKEIFREHFPEWAGDGLVVKFRS